MTQTIPDFHTVNLESLGGLVGVIYGMTEAGKTSLVVSAYQHEALRKVGVIDVDDGLQTVVNWSDEYVKRAEVTSVLQLENIAKATIAQVAEKEKDEKAGKPIEDKYPLTHFNTYVIDSMTRLVEWELASIAKQEYEHPTTKERRASFEQVQIQDYKFLAARVSRMLDTFKRTNKTLLMTAGVRDDDPDPNSPNPKLKNLKRARRGAMPEAVWNALCYRADFVWYQSILTDGTITLLTKKWMSPEGREVFAKTRNEKFSNKLISMTMKGKEHMPGLVRIGHVYDSEVQQLNFKDLYNLYLECI